LGIYVISSLIPKNSLTTNPPLPTPSNQILPTGIETGNEFLSLTPASNNDVWVSYSHPWGYSIKAPKGATVKFCEFASSDGVCENIEGYFGVYLPDNQYPYGILFNQTVLKGETSAIPAGFTSQYPSSTPSDIDFGVPGAMMATGKESVKIYSGPQDTQGKSVEYAFTRYIFRKGDFYFMPSIQTNLSKTDFDTLKKILATWKFTKPDNEFYLK
jgi:hypothetical protein